MIAPIIKRNPRCKKGLWLGHNCTATATACGKWCSLFDPPKIESETVQTSQKEIEDILEKAGKAKALECHKCGVKVRFRSRKDMKKQFRKHFRYEHPDIFEDIHKQEAMIIELQRQIRKQIFGDRKD